MMRRNQWRAAWHDPAIPLCRLLYRDIPDAPISHFLATLPEPLTIATQSIFLNQIPLLHWAANSHLAMQLICANPVLSWILIDHFQSNEIDFHKADQLLLRPMPELLSMASGVRTKSAVHLLKKTRLRRGRKNDLAMIKQGIVDEEIRHCLTHLDIIPAPLFAALSQAPVLIGCGFLPELAENMLEVSSDVLDESNQVSRLLEDTIRIGGQLRIPEAEATARRCRSIAQLRRLHDRWTQRYNARGLALRQLIGERFSFPPPPIPGCADITPIRTQDALTEEGRTMEHCVGSYAGMVALGSRYIYRVLRPERGTLSLEMDSEGIRIGEFNLAGNEEPSDASWHRVNDWFEQSRHHFRKRNG